MPTETAPGGCEAWPQPQEGAELAPGEDAAHVAAAARRAQKVWGAQERRDRGEVLRQRWLWPGGLHSVSADAGPGHTRA